MFNLNHPYSDPGLASPDVPDEFADKVERTLQQMMKDGLIQASDIPGPGKFEGNASLAVSEALYDIVNSGFEDEQFGEAETSTWEALIISNPKDIGHGSEHFKIKPAYIVTEDSQGFFTYKDYDSEEEARAQFERDLEVYNAAYHEES